MTKFVLPPLPYAHNALEPAISARTLEYHYDRHHRGYVDKLNELAPPSSGDDEALSALVRTASGALFNNAAQTWNHTFYWRSMAPDGPREPAADPGDLLRSRFGSIDAFRQRFAEAATGQFGSGWAWLVKTADGRLEITSTSDADNPLRDGHWPLLTLDVWEHAYYLDYQNDRGAYVEAFVDRLINWALVSERLRAARD
jgi:superoxide dismutase, Fe-Mn family